LIPDFNEHGYLPPGIHPATLDEIEQRFGLEPEVRRVEMQSLRWLVDLARRAGVQRLLINGSFVTDEWEPNDVDCALLPKKDYPKDAIAAKELSAGLPFLHVDLAKPTDFDTLVNEVFATDRFVIPKGVVEVLLWT
jgi:hypothetical protein